MTGQLLRVLEINNVQLRADIKAAIGASPDQYIATQEALMKPQLLFGVEWTQTNIDEKVLRMGWASLGHRTLGAPILGMFVLIESKLCFVRKDDKQRKDGNIQVYEIASISKVETTGWLALKGLSFAVKGKSGHVEWQPKR
ncbi:MAG: hypothetical protein SGARI_007910 [Bacillariaceae sp.]